MAEGAGFESPPGTRRRCRRRPNRFAGGFCLPTAHQQKEKGAVNGSLFFLAEGAGFEPAWTFALTVFKTAPL